jgi:fructokinase
LGGTKIEAIAMDAHGRELLRKRIPTPQGDYAGTVAAVASLVRQVESEIRGEARVGVGMPGAFSTITGLVKNSNSTCLIGKPLKEDLRAALGREVRMENDANCFALSEASDGAGKGARIVFGVILGTGVGGGIVVDGKAIVGPNAITGEWGHNPLPRASGPDLPLHPCYCGRAGCIEMYLSGPALERDGGAKDEAAMARYEERLARSLAGVINILDPHVIVLGGGVSNLDRLYESVPRLWKPHVFSDHVATKLAKAVHGDSSGVRGAAWLWNT